MRSLPTLKQALLIVRLLWGLCYNSIVYFFNQINLGIYYCSHNTSFVFSKLSQPEALLYKTHSVFNVHMS
jgi:hypothetical protein